MTSLLGIICLLLSALDIALIRQNRRAWKRADEALAQTESVVAMLEQSTASLTKSNATVATLLAEKRAAWGLTKQDNVRYPQ